LQRIAARIIADKNLFENQHDHPSRVKRISPFTADSVERWAMSEKYRMKYTIVGATICSLAGLLTGSASVTAYAAECLAAPNAQSGPGTRWHYRIDQATKQRCWYLKDLRGSRPGSESAAATSPPPRGAGSELSFSAAPAESEASITAWFSSKLAALTGAVKGSPPSEVGEPSTNGPPVTRKRLDAERTELKKPQQNKSEQQSKSEQSKSEREHFGSERAQERLAMLFARILEAAGDKLVPNATIELTEESLTSAIEAVGEKDVVTPRIDLEEDWQKALYEEFLVWRSKQLLLQESPVDLARDDHRR
jgi:hypothetical protein